MSKPYHRTGPPGEELILDWASDLTPDQRNSLYDVLDGELERRDKGRIPAARFIARITTARRYKKVAKWVQ
ncbi:MAG TPA: hypothetical protein VEX13_16715, partial [Chloroflexia bacterium]|nr:hypothetical protein [Chloroflexia bacterium]